MPKNENNKYVYRIVLCGLMIALSIIFKFITQYVPIAGAMVVRMDFYGPFEKLPAMLFGPVTGGVVGSLVDFLGYVFANKTPVGYIPLLTITAFLNCAGFALIWRLLKHVSKRKLQNVYMIISGGVLLVGVINTWILKSGITGSYYDKLTELGDLKDYVSIGLIIVGVLAFAFIAINLLIMRASNKAFLTENFFKLFIALFIPSMIISVLNTGILILFIDALKDKVFGLFLIPRLGAQVVETFYDTYILGTIMSLFGGFFHSRTVGAMTENE